MTVTTEIGRTAQETPVPALPTQVVHPMDFVAITYRGTKNITPFDDLGFAMLHVQRNSPGFIYRVSQVCDPDKGLLCRGDNRPIYSIPFTKPVETAVATTEQEESWI